jgi:hypothetical protein
MTVGQRLDTARFVANTRAGTSLCPYKYDFVFTQLQKAVEL